MKSNTSSIIKTFVSLFIILTFVEVSGQKSIEQDSTSIISFVDKIIIKANIDTQTDTYVLNDKLDNTFLKLTPNTNLRLTLSLDYEFIGLSIGLSPKFLPGNNDDNLKGESSFSDYRFRFFLGDWTQELEYSNVEGYYVENTNDFIPNWTEGEDAYIQFPNLKIVTWGGSTSYIFNPEFSLRNVVYQTEWQRKSAGSFLPKFDYNYTELSNIIDNVQAIENIFNFQLAASYYYTWVIQKNWFISPFLSPTLGIRFSKYDDGINSIEKNRYFIKKLESGLQLGFSSKKIVFGANVNFNVNWYNEDRTTRIVNDKLYAKIYFGYRFNAPKIVRKPFKWINKKLGI